MPDVLPFNPITHLYFSGPFSEKQGQRVLRSVTQDSLSEGARFSGWDAKDHDVRLLGNGV